MIKLKNVYFKYNSNNTKEFILNNLNFTINKNEFVSIIGPNGVGKSSLVKLLSGIIKPTKGDIFISDFNTKSNSDFMNIRKTVSVVFQNPDNQIIFERVYEELEFSLKRQNLSNEEIEKRIDSALEMVNMSEYKYSLCNTLSMGQKQKIIIAEALSQNTDCIILDEPTAMLDPISKKQILELLVTLNSYGKTIILITHILDEIFYSKRCIYLKDNIIYKDISIDNILNTSNSNLDQRNNIITFLEEINNNDSNFIITLLTKIYKNNININFNVFLQNQKSFNEFLTDEIIKKIISKD